MKINIVTPAPRGSTAGNRVTAERWARILCTLGHRVRILVDYQSDPCDLMIALHARKSAHAAARFKSGHPDAPLVVCLTGTDLYRDIHRSTAARRTLELATRLVALHDSAVAQLPDRMRGKLRVIYQSANQRPREEKTANQDFAVCVLGHLRAIKDPFRAAMASRCLPSHSRIRIVQVGAALSESMERRARNEQAKNSRYVWLGERRRTEALRILSRSNLLVLSSKAEGGANVISEAVVASVPILASRIVSSVDLLGRDYPGFFEVGDTGQLRQMMLHAEASGIFYRSLSEHLSRLADLFAPEREYASWRGLLAEIS